jgi:hypothetical protein
VRLSAPLPSPLYLSICGALPPKILRSILPPGFLPAFDLLPLPPPHPPPLQTTQQAQRPEFCELMAGNSVLTAQGGKAAAHCYCGYQFGSFAGQLGDGAGTPLERRGGGVQHSSTSLCWGRYVFLAREQGGACGWGVMGKYLLGCVLDERGQGLICRAVGKWCRYVSGEGGGVFPPCVRVCVLA